MARRPSRRGRPTVPVAALTARALLRGHDHGDGISVLPAVVGATGDRWVEPFLSANENNLRRLDLNVEVRADRRVHVVLMPGARVGAIPLLAPATRRVVAGLLVEPRFRWPALGAVLNSTGFSVEPSLGGAPLVPGSAREVPPWVLAGPVIQRIAAFLAHRRWDFAQRTERRVSPRGHVEWTQWAVTNVPRGSWTTFPCRFSEPDTDPHLLAAARWTLRRLRDQLTLVDHSVTARYLVRRAIELQAVIGPGPEAKLRTTWPLGDKSEWIANAVQAMTWVAEERGLGGENTLDGLAWDLSIEAVWESWVSSFARDLSGHLGLVASSFQSVSKPLRWEGPVRSMTSLAPDVELRGADRVVLLDAKYKRHLDLLARRGWSGASEDLRHQHRADLHQALAYAALADVPRVDTILAYPSADTDRPRAATIARVASGRRLVRLVLASIPFGYRNEEQRESCLRSFRDLLAA